MVMINIMIWIKSRGDNIYRIHFFIMWLIILNGTFPLLLFVIAG